MENNKNDQLCGENCNENGEIQRETGKFQGENENINSLKTNPESAIRAGDRYYRAALEERQPKLADFEGEDGETPPEREQRYEKRPIFVVLNKQKDDLQVNAAYLYHFFRLTEKVAYLRNDALETEIRYLYKNGVYRQCSGKDIRKILHDYVGEYRYRFQDPYKAELALRLIDDNAKCFSHDVMNADENIINFQNGLLDLEKMRIISHDSKKFSTVQIPCKWMGKAAPTPNFDRFLDTLTSGNREKQRLLLQYMGAVMSNIYGSRFKKALFLVGAGNTGKSVISGVLSRILGEKNTNERNLKRLSERFGETAVYMKRLVFSSDMSFMKIDQMDRFKELTGGDTISIEFKNNTHFNYRFRGLLMFAMNALPLFGGDKGEWVYDRILIVKCLDVIREKERDPRLIEKIFEEREGIIFKCVMVLLDAVKNGYRFDIPDECRLNTQEYKEKNSSVVEFWNECMEQIHETEKHGSPSQTVYDCFRNWAQSQGLKYTPPFPEFRNEVAAYLGRPWENGTKRGNKGVCLTDWKIGESGKDFLPQN